MIYDEHASGLVDLRHRYDRRCDNYLNRRTDLHGSRQIFRTDLEVRYVLRAETPARKLHLSPRAFYLTLCLSLISRVRLCRDPLGRFGDKTVPLVSPTTDLAAG
jgi:hypothetical protein